MEQIAGLTRVGWGATPPAAEFAVAAVGRLPPDALAAVAALRAQVTVTAGWDAVDDLALNGPPALVIAAAPRGIGHGALEHLAAVIEETGSRAVVAFEDDALDAAAAALMGPPVMLLCDPGPSDWATALALATYGTSAAPAGVREGGDDAERLLRMNEEVARIAALLAALVEERAVDPTGVGDRRTRYAAGPGDDAAIDAPVLAGDIRRVIRARRLRAAVVDKRLIEDPGWDMLLDLFAAELERAQVSVSSLCIASAVAPTTALRWITRMVEAGLLRRVPDAEDRRRAFLVLSRQASDAMRGYASAAKRAGLPIA